MRQIIGTKDGFIIKEEDGTITEFNREDKLDKLLAWANQTEQTMLAFEGLLLKINDVCVESGAE